MPKFFLPAADDEQAAEQNYAVIRQFVVEQLGALDDRRVFRLDYVHDGQDRFAQVGEPWNGNGELVIAIFKRLNYGLYLVCTPNRGVVRGGPILVGEHDVNSSRDFKS